jgi:hypothetical protein
MMWFVLNLPMWVAPLVSLSCVGVLIVMLVFTTFRS